MRYRLVYAVCVLVVMTVAGCLSPRTDSSEIHTYQLSLDGWSGETRSHQSEGPVLLVSPPQAEPGYETQRMVYLKRPYELEYYAVNQWADSPIHMLTPLLVQVLSQSGVWNGVIPLPSTIRGDYRLDSYGFALQHEFLQQPSRVRVMLRTQLVDLNAATILSTRTFEVVENAKTDNPYGGVQAANRAVAALLEQLDSWLRQCVQQLPECRR